MAIANRDYRSIYSGLDLSGWKNSKANDGHWKANDWVLSYDGKSFASDTALVSTESFGDFGFLMDFRLKKDSGVPIVQLRGASGFRLVLAGVEDSAEPVIKPGQWVRIEGTVIENRISVSVDGKDLQIDFKGRLPESGPLRLIPDGAVDFANIYVRDVKTE